MTMIASCDRQIQISFKNENIGAVIDITRVAGYRIPHKMYLHKTYVQIKTWHAILANYDFNDETFSRLPLMAWHMELVFPFIIYGQINTQIKLNGNADNDQSWTVYPCTLPAYDRVCLSTKICVYGQQLSTCDKLTSCHLSWKANSRTGLFYGTKFIIERIVWPSLSAVCTLPLSFYCVFLSALRLRNALSATIFRHKMTLILQGHESWAYLVCYALPMKIKRLLRAKVSEDDEYEFYVSITKRLFVSFLAFQLAESISGNIPMKSAISWQYGNARRNFFLFYSSLTSNSPVNCTNLIVVTSSCKCHSMDKWFIVSIRFAIYVATS